MQSLELLGGHKGNLKLAEQTLLHVVFFHFASWRYYKYLSIIRNKIYAGKLL
jgi:hypothetical protein